MKIKVAELFAGVGGFRLGLEGWLGKSATSGYKEPLETPFKVVWSNQWEPSTKVQHASLVYEKRFGKDFHTNEDVATIDISAMPDFDMLVGGFPCQDYSVASTLKNSKGIVGKKGVLWWSIHKILTEKVIKPKILMLENVDRLLISPSKQRGRDFAIMLKSLSDLGYAVEWRVINAAEYGMPQRRKRVFILGYLKETKIYNDISKSTLRDWILVDGVIAGAFPVSPVSGAKQYDFDSFDISQISDTFNASGAKGVFENAGVTFNGDVYTLKTAPEYDGGFTTLGDVLQDGDVADEFYISDESLDKWRYQKGAKRETRVNSSGFEYNYTEGSMLFPDDTTKASRTIITGEGGSSASRFKHVVKGETGYRRLTPVELERLNMFPDNHTENVGVTNTKRAFFMGNALVVGIIEKLGRTLYNRLLDEKSL